ncbi:hypothetical protein Pan216_21260 [Planctomycetes bacterium Pan216]|uniref:Uncharacterized protein n=1 Tax=Kolteria novifilia TaxID=2527975 RepID=A0A518B2V3_9BACT|nr:hypothetical protein Pan216_21260 [Planctomycetes bacterium Pan216]
MEVKIGDDVVKPIVEAKIQAAIIEVLGNEKGLIERVVGSIINRKVKEREYSSNTIPWIEHVCRDVIRDATEQAIQEWAKSNQGVLVEEFKRQFGQKKTHTAMVKAMLDGMIEASASRFRFKVEFPSE